jgi:hypothetical protein
MCFIEAQCNLCQPCPLYASQIKPSCQQGKTTASSSYSYGLFFRKSKCFPQDAKGKRKANPARLADMMILH